MDDIVPREKLVKDGLKGFLATGGGIGLLILKGISSVPLFGAIVGGILAVIGMGFGISKEDKPAGVIALTTGVLTIIASFLPGVRWLMSVAGWGLLIGGAVSLYKFFKKLKTRM